MWDSLPETLQEHIQFLSDDFCASATPSAPSSHSVLCIPPSVLDETPLPVSRDLCDLPVPTQLRQLLGRYSADTSFTWKWGWTWMSENEIRQRRDEMVQRGQMRMVDLGFRYMGMGHVRVLSYDPVTGGVFTTLDGGSNGWDRQYNHEERIKCAVHELKMEPFDEWVKGDAGADWC